MHVVSEQISQGDYKTANSSEEREVLKLMSEVKAVSSHAAGSGSLKVVMHNEMGSHD